MSDFQNRYEQLRARYTASLLQKLTEIETAWAALQKDPDTPAVRSELQRHVHRLSGSAAAYGFEQVGNLARQVDTQLIKWATAIVGPHATSPQDLIVVLQDDVAALRMELAAHIASAASSHH